MGLIECGFFILTSSDFDIRVLYIEINVLILLQIYRILGKTVVCYPIIFDLSDFYMSQDVMMLIDDIKVNVCHLLSCDKYNPARYILLFKICVMSSMSL